MKHLTKIERMQQITRLMEALTRWYGALGDDTYRVSFTMTEIARHINMRPSGHLRGLIEACVSAGWLDKETEPYRTGLDKTAYRITPEGENFAAELNAMTLWG